MGFALHMDRPARITVWLTGCQFVLDHTITRPELDYRGVFTLYGDNLRVEGCVFRVPPGPPFVVPRDLLPFLEPPEWQPVEMGHTRWPLRTTLLAQRIPRPLRR